jgi:hypothetical protein
MITFGATIGSLIKFLFISFMMKYGQLEHEILQVQ